MTIFFRKLALYDADGRNRNPSSGNSGGAGSNGQGGETGGDMETFMDAYYVQKQLTGEYRDRLSHWLSAYSKRVNSEGVPPELRRQNMDGVNPKYVLRNYLAQQAIDKVEKGDFSMVHDLLELLRHPYSEQPEYEKFAVKRPEWARNRPGCSMLSCSS